MKIKRGIVGRLSGQESVLSKVQLRDDKRPTVGDIIELYAYADAVIETIRYPLLILDSKLSIKSANKAYFDTFQVRKEDILEKRLIDVNHELWKNAIFRKTLRTIIPHNSRLDDFEITATLGAIGERTLQISARRITLSGRKTKLILISFIDITERKRIANQLLISERRYRSIFESAKDAIVYADFDGLLLEFNKAYEKMTGYRRDELLAGIHYQDITPKKYQQLDSKMLEELIKTGKPVEYEKEYINKNDKVVSIVLTKFLVKDNDGKVTGSAAIIRDITQRRKTEENLSKSEQRYHSLVETIPHIVWIATNEGKLEYLNSQWSLYTGNHDTNEGMSSKFVHPDDFSEVIKRWEKSVKTKSIYDVEYRLRRQDGVYRWFHARSIPIKDKKGNVVQWFGTATDIDDQKQSDLRKNEFVSMASHELKNPLTSIKVFAQILDKRFIKAKDSQQNRYFIKHIITLVDGMVFLIDELLDLGKIETGRLILKKKRFDLMSLIRNTVINSQYSTDTHTISATLDGEVFINGDRARIGEVLINLIANSIKYSPKGTDILITTKTSKKQIIVSVQDYGRGIPQDKQSQIFNRYYRVSEKGALREKGSGLGLYLSSEIIKLHKGKIWFESKEGKGSIFYFSLPLSLVNNQVKK